MITFFTDYTLLFEWLAGFSFVFFILTLLVIPWLVINIPYDYFTYKKRQKGIWSHSSRWISFIKNLLGSIIIVMGIFMLILPGQGILTILLGVMITNFPGKYKLERRLIQQPTVQYSVNWLRKKANKKPLYIDKKRRKKEREELF